MVNQAEGRQWWYTLCTVLNEFKLDTEDDYGQLYL
jgi:hypothetical protein